MTQMPANLLRPVPAFEAAYDARAGVGSEVLARSRIAFVGLARNCAGPLAANAWGESPPRTAGAASRLAAKGRNMLQKYELQKD